MNFATRTAVAGALALGVAVLASCTSSGATKTPLDTTTPAPPSSQSAPVTPTTSTTPTPRPTRSLSAFEQDPAVTAMRAWAAQAGRTVNQGRFIDGALRDLMTARFAKTMKSVLGSEVGLRYPGPLPIQPLGVTVLNHDRREVRACAIVQGFSLNRRTGKPAQAYEVAPVDVFANQVNGRWLIDDLTGARDVKCAGVRVQAPKW